MKKLDFLLIKAFIGPFILTTLVLVFIFLTGEITKKLDDLVGKGLDFAVFGQLLFYFSMQLIPRSLPLAVLFASLITFGNLGQHKELTAIKSSGISLLRVLLPLFLLVICIAIASFWFSNNIVPKTNLKAYSLLYDIKQKKPTLSIKEGVFSDNIPEYSIKVNEKMPNGKDLKEIIIYHHDKGRDGNREITVADSGTMYTVHYDTYLKLELYNGYTYYEDVKNIRTRSNEKFVKNQFQKSEIWFDLSFLNMDTTDQNLFKGHRFMKNVIELGSAIDSMSIRMTNMKNNHVSGLRRFYQHIPVNQIDSSLIGRNLKNSKDSILKAKFEQTKAHNKQIYSAASNRANSILRHTENQERILEHSREEIDKYAVEWHKKFADAVACLIMFLIGAPLGAIIKKGGLGFPLLLSVIFFIIFYVISLMGEKWAKDDVVEPYISMWVANFTLFWVGLLFLRQAKNDSRLLEWDGFYVFVDKIIKFFSRKNKKTLDMSAKS